ncbi:hypothetical protein [Rhodopirellula sallentina]|nr:hypothetical protein [Rhodopirellula sallentina]
MSGPGGQSNASAETWTSLSGDKSIEAEMVGMWDNQIVLVLSNGRRINVPINSFEAGSRIQAGKIAERLEQERRALTEEIKRNAEIEAAPAPNPLPTPPTPPEYSPPSTDMGPDDAVDAIAQQIRNGHLVVLYDAMPPKFRSQLDQLAALTMQKLDPQGIADPLGQIHRIADLLVTRQNWILSHPRLLDPSGEPGDLSPIGETFTNLLLPIAETVRVGIPADEVALDRIREQGFGAWLHSRDAAVAPYLTRVMDSYTGPAASWTLLKQKDDEAVLEQSLPQSNERGHSRANPPSRKLALKRVDGYWLPAAVADGFEEWVKQKTEELQGVDDASMSVSEWLGGSYVSVPTPAAQPTRNGMGQFDDPSQYGRPDEYDDMSQYDDMSEFDEDLYMDDSYGGDMYGQSGGAKPRMIDAPTISAEAIGSVLQSVGGVVSMLIPLEEATDAASFHRAADQVAGSVQGLLSLVGGR